MTVRLYSPEIALRSQTTGILLFNQMGASVHEDTGRDADYYTSLGLHVLAADRPGSGYDLPTRGTKLAASYIDALSRFASRRIMPEVEKAGLQRLIVTGRSAGGLAALVATATEQLPVAAVHAQEAVGWSETSVEAGRQHFNAYRERQRALLADPKVRLISPEPTDQTGLAFYRRKGAIILHSFVDQRNNREVWNQSLADQSAYSIAATQPDVRLDLWFAKDSLVANDEFIESLGTTLPSLREPSDAPVEIFVMPRTVHASFDLRSFSTIALKRTVDKIVPPAAT